MNIRIKTTDYKMPAKVSDYLDERVQSLEKLLGENADVARVEVELGRASGRRKHSDYQWFAEILIRAPGISVRATNHEATINAGYRSSQRRSHEPAKEEKDDAHQQGAPKTQ